MDGEAYGRHERRDPQVNRYTPNPPPDPEAGSDVPADIAATHGGYEDGRFGAWQPGQTPASFVPVDPAPQPPLFRPPPGYPGVVGRTEDVGRLGDVGRPGASDSGLSHPEPPRSRLSTGSTGPVPYGAPGDQTPHGQPPHDPLRFDASRLEAPRYSRPGHSVPVTETSAPTYWPGFGQEHENNGRVGFGPGYSPTEYRQPGYGEPIGPGAEVTAFDATAQFDRVTDAEARPYERPPPYERTPYEQTPYEQTPYGQTSYGRIPYEQSSYGRTPYEQTSYGRTPYGQTSYGRTPYGRTPYGRMELAHQQRELAPVRGRRRAEPEEDNDETEEDNRRSMPLWQELPLLLVVAFCLAVLIRTFLLQAFYIPSGSMENTLLVGDRVLVNKIVYDVRTPERGEVIVFRGTDNWAPEHPAEPAGSLLGRIGRTLGDLVGVSRPGEKDFIKRVVGLPGDRVSCCDGGGRIFVNGRALDEPYVEQDSPLEVEPDPRVCRSRRFDEVVVPAGQLFVMGDHRIVSQDSRCQGTVPIENVIGRAFVIVWPNSRWETLGVPDNFLDVPDPVAIGVPAEPPPARDPIGPDFAAAVLSLPVLATLTVTSRPGRRRR
jgi:signal peptidase I